LGGCRVLRQVKDFLRRFSFKKLYADGTYNAKSFRKWVKAKFEAVLVTSKNLAQKFKTFNPASQRWVV
jgi:hypothetical protein